MWGLLVLLLLTGCTGKGDELDRVMALRAKLLSGECTFDAEITADYLTEVYTVGVTCRMDAGGNVAFTVTAPESIAGITGTLARDEGRLTFDDAALAFGLLADGEISPVSAPWILIRTLRSGYLTSCAVEGELLRVAIDDSYAADALHLDVWLTGQDVPCRADIAWKDRRILSLEIKNFTIV